MLRISFRIHYDISYSIPLEANNLYASVTRNMAALLGPLSTFWTYMSG